MKVTIKFNKKIYSLTAIETSIKSFKHLAKFQVKNTKDYIIIVLSQIQPDIKKTIKEEFSNYVLANVKNV